MLRVVGTEQNCTTFEPKFYDYHFSLHSIHTKKLNPTNFVMNVSSSLLLIFFTIITKRSINPTNSNDKRATIQLHEKHNHSNTHSSYTILPPSNSKITNPNFINIVKLPIKLNKLLNNQFISRTRRTIYTTN